MWKLELFLSKLLFLLIEKASHLLELSKSRLKNIIYIKYVNIIWE